MKKPHFVVIGNGPPTGSAPLRCLLGSGERVSQRALELAVDAPGTIDDGAYACLQIRLKCGIQCGPCGPEIRHYN